MSDNPWNDDITYAFSINKTVMQILGTWPLQKKTIFTMMQWSLMTILQLMTFSFLFMDITRNHRDAGASIETILFFTCLIIMVLKHFCITANQKKLARNIDVAMCDWISARNDEKSYKIMKKNAFKSRLFTLIIVYSACTGGIIYILGVVFLNLKQMFLHIDINTSNDNISMTDWIFIIPSGDLGEKITGPQYTMLIVVQSFQIIVMSLSQSIMDSFYINITLHLNGQLKVLQTKLKTFANKPDTEANYRKQLISLLNRHCELTELNQNIEDTFHLVILFQLVVITLLLALLGLRIIYCLKNNNYIELIKSVMALNYMFMEALVYSYGGDFVQRGSEGVFHAMFMTSWFTLPVGLMKDLHFAMMRASYPFRLTGGKFFYANRETMVYVLKTAASYVSVLRMALRD